MQSEQLLMLRQVSERGVNNMYTMIKELCRALWLIKDFDAGCRGSAADNGLMLIEYRGTRYAVKMVEMSTTDQDVDLHNAVDNVKIYFKEDK